MSKFDGYDVSKEASQYNELKTRQSVTKNKPVIPDFQVNKTPVARNNPINFRVRESCENEYCPDKVSISFWIDSTGSMKEWPRYLLPALGKIFYKLYGSSVVKGMPDISFGSVGDVCDREVLYMNEYEMDERLNEVLRTLTMPGKGGNNIGESYDAALLASGMKSKLHCVKRGKKGLLMLLLDEPNTTGPLSADNIRRFIDSEYSGPDLTLEEIIAQVREQFVICVVVVETASSRKFNVAQWWKERLGEQYIHEIPQSLQTDQELLATTFCSIIEHHHPEMIANVHCTYAELHDLEHKELSSVTTKVQNLSIVPGVSLSDELVNKISQTLEAIKNSTTDQAFYLSVKRVGQQHVLETLLQQPIWSAVALEQLQEQMDEIYPDWCAAVNGNSPIARLFDEVLDFVRLTATQQQNINNSDEMKPSGMGL